MKKNYLLTLLLTLLCGNMLAQEVDLFSKVLDPTSLKDKDTIILACQGQAGDNDFTIVAGPMSGKQLTAIKENVTLTADAAGAEGAVKLVLNAATGGFRLVPDGKSKGIAENGNCFYEQNTKNNSIWEFQSDENGVFVHNVGNYDAYIKYNPQNDYIRPYKLGSVGPVLMYVYVRPFVDRPKETIHPASVELSATTLELKVSETHQLKATVSPSNADDKSVTWSSSDETIVVVTPQGIVRAIQGGEATVTVTTVDGGLTAECAVTVIGGTMPGDDKGTEEQPYSVSDVIVLNNSNSDHAWVEGYIWGTPKSGKALGDDADTSIALGENEEYTEGDSFVPCQLPTAIRKELGLSSNPENKGRKVKVYGQLAAYFSVPGVKNVTKYVWLDIKDDTKQQSSDRDFEVSNGKIIILNNSQEAVVYNLQGQVVSRGTKTTNVNSGVYIIRIGEKVAKVMVK